MQSSETRHIRVGYLNETWGDITLTSDHQPHFHGDQADALHNLYQSAAAQPLYHGLTPSQVLARMTQRMNGPTWAVAIDADGLPTRI